MPPCLQARKIMMLRALSREKNKWPLLKSCQQERPNVFPSANSTQMYSRACLFSPLQAKACLACVLISLCFKGAPWPKGPVLPFKGVQTPCLSKWHDICIKPELRCSGAADAFRKPLALFLSISLAGDHLAHASVSAQPASEPAQGGRNWASCLTTLMLKCVEHSQATELC